MDCLSSFKICLMFLANDIMRTVQTDTTDTRDLKSPSAVFNLKLDVRGKCVEVNLFWRVSTSALTEISREAATSLNILLRGGDTAFDRVFLQPNGFHERYHEFFSIDFRGPSRPSSGVKRKDSNDADFVSRTTHKLFEVLSFALRDRISAIRIIPIMVGTDVESDGASFGTNPHSFRCSIEQDHWQLSYRIFVGLVLNENSGKRVEKGPSADDTDGILRFRKFWGSEKCVLRRFQDGTVLETVLWGSESQNSILQSNDDIIQEVVRYSLGKHASDIAGVAGGNVHFLSSSVEKDLSIHLKPLAATSTRQALNIMEELRSIIYKLNDSLPVIIETVSAASPYLRYTSLSPTQPSTVDVKNDSSNGAFIDILTSPIALVCSVESSGKWPSDPVASETMRRAYLVRVSKLLKKQFSISSRYQENSLDAIYRGYVFRLFLSTIRQSSVSFSNCALLRSISLKSIVSNLSYPVHHMNIHNLHSKFASYSDTVRLLRSWLAIQMLSDHIPHEAVELLVANSYIGDQVVQAPSTAFEGFRATIKLISEHNWESLPLMVCFSEDGFSSADISSILDKFSFYRTRNPRYASMFIVTSAEKYLSFEPIVSAIYPEPVVLNIIVKTAKECLKHIRSICSGNMALSNASESILSSCKSLSGSFNVVLQLNSNLVGSHPRYSRLKYFKNIDDVDYIDESKIICRSGATFQLQKHVLKLLRANFHDQAIFFWNELSGDLIGVVFRPRVFMTSNISVMNCQLRLPLESLKAFQKKVLTVPNVPEMIAGFRSVAEGLIADIIFL